MSRSRLPFYSTKRNDKITIKKPPLEGKSGDGKMGRQKRFPAWFVFRSISEEIIVITATIEGFQIIPFHFNPENETTPQRGDN